MTRPSKSTPLDLTQTHDLAVGVIERLTCPNGNTQIFLRDGKTPGLRVRVTTTGTKSFVFEAKLNRQTVRRTIGDVRSWTIDQARTEARRLAVILDNGQDPREIERQRQQENAQAKAGGLLSEKRGGKFALTKPGPLASLMGYRLADLTQKRIEAWAALEGQTRPSSARLAWRLLAVFLTWCAEQPAYAAMLPAKYPAKTKKAREALGKAGTKTDNLQRGQLPVWFAAFKQLQNPTIAACLQIMLLTGARPGEVLGLRWEDVNTQWSGIAIRDKVEGTREIPLTPYVANLLASLPRRNEWVFSSPASASGCLTEPNTPHHRACKVAGLEGLTLHGLRRSFKSLTEWLEVPVGVVAQIQGHKPSATAEKHYTVRPLELLALHHKRIEAWILEQAGIVFDAQAEPGKLRVVV